jgi:hypothetical protein
MSERVLLRSDRDAGPHRHPPALLPPAPEGFADMINAVAAENLARAWLMEPTPV